MADLIDSLIGYVKDVKPYHTKIFGVEVEYVTKEDVEVEVTEDFKMNIFMGLPVNEMKQLGEWSRERWVPSVVGPRFDTLDSSWDNIGWDEGVIGDPISSTNPGVSIDRKNKAHEAQIRALYGDIGFASLPFDSVPLDRVDSIDESYRDAILYPRPTGFMDLVYAKVTEDLKISIDVVGGDVGDIHNYTLPLWDADYNGIDITGTAPNTIYAKGNIESIINGMAEFSVRPNSDMNVGWGTGSLDQRTYDEFDGIYTVINALYDEELDSTVISVIEDVPSVTAGFFSYGQIEISLYDAGEWDGYISTHIEQPDADLNASPEISESFEVVDGYKFDDPMAGGWDSPKWDEGLFILKGTNTIPRKYEGYDFTFFDTELWDAEPYFKRERYDDGGGLDSGLMDSGTSVEIKNDNEIGTIVFSYDDLPTPNPQSGRRPSSLHGIGYDVDESSDTWVVTHNLGYNPIARVYDTEFNVLEPLEIIHESSNTLTIKFTTPKTGSVRLI